MASDQSRRQKKSRYTKEMRDLRHLTDGSRKIIVPVIPFYPDHNKEMVPNYGSFRVIMNNLDGGASRNVTVTSFKNSLVQFLFVIVTSLHKQPRKRMENFYHSPPILLEVLVLIIGNVTVSMLITSSAAGWPQRHSSLRLIWALTTTTMCLEAAALSRHSSLPNTLSSSGWT